MFFKVNILAFPRWITNFRDSLHSKGGVVPAYFWVAKYAFFVVGRPLFYLGKEEAKKICIHIGKHADAHDTLEFE